MGGRSRPARISGWTSPRSSSGSSASGSTMVAGTARPRTGRCDPRSDTTINVLDGLLEFERATGGSADVGEARRSGEEYLLERGLLRRKSTGEVADRAFLDFAFPFYWRYDVLRALDYFRALGRRARMPGWRRPSRSCGPNDSPMAGGCSTGCIPAGSTSTSRPTSDRPVAGTLSAPCECSTGGTRGRPRRS